MRRQTYGANSSSGALKSGASCITPGCRGETRRTVDFAPFTVRAAAWQTFSRSHEFQGLVRHLRRLSHQASRVVIQLNCQRRSCEALYRVQVGFSNHSFKHLKPPAYLTRQTILPQRHRISAPISMHNPRPDFRLRTVSLPAPP